MSNTSTQAFSIAKTSPVPKPGSSSTNNTPSHNHESNKSNKMYRCKTCNEEFVHRNVLKTHNETMHSSVRVPCDQCDKTFTTKSSLRLHKEAIHDGIRYQCNYCDKSFGQLGSLRRHMKSIHPNMKAARGTNDIMRSASEKSQSDESTISTPSPVSRSLPRTPSALGAGDSSPRSTGSESTASLLSVSGFNVSPSELSKSSKKRLAPTDLMKQWPGASPKQRRASTASASPMHLEEFAEFSDMEAEQEEVEEEDYQDQQNIEDVNEESYEGPYLTFNPAETQAIAILVGMQNNLL